jgi:hypothetical protein
LIDMRRSIDPPALTRDESGPSTLLPDCQHVHDGELPLIALSGADAQPG